MQLFPAARTQRTFETTHENTNQSQDQQNNWHETTKKIFNKYKKQKSDTIKTLL